MNLFFLRIIRSRFIILNFEPLQQIFLFESIYSAIRSFSFMKFTNMNQQLFIKVKYTLTLSAKMNFTSYIIFVIVYISTTTLLSRTKRSRVFVAISGRLIGELIMARWRVRLRIALVVQLIEKQILFIVY